VERAQFERPAIFGLGAIAICTRGVQFFESRGVHELRLDVAGDGDDRRPSLRASISPLKTEKNTCGASLAAGAT
jgi:hypothetical protein